MTSLSTKGLKATCAIHSVTSSALGDGMMSTGNVIPLY